MPVISNMGELSPEQLKQFTLLVTKLSSLGFSAGWERLEYGPVVNTFFLTPTPTSLFSKISGKGEDLAMALGSDSVLIRREKNLVSFSIALDERKPIRFDQAIHNLSKAQALPILMGQSTTGNFFSIDLAKQPHILVAGSTGSGKSVFLSEVIAALSLRLEPSELEMFLVDTKQLDLTLFTSLAHVKGVCTDVLQLHLVLDSLLKEVRKRTELFKGAFRNLSEYNDSSVPRLPHILLIIDELADVIGLDLELAKDEDKEYRRTRITEKLKNLAQISRAAGIHIIAATQRPSVKIISGDIKANFPTRICFKLPSQVDSRVVLDDAGAELLLGKGDYLFISAEAQGIKRGHSAFITLEDISTIVEQHEMIRNSLRAKEN